MKITMVEICDFGSNEEFANIMLRYGKLGYTKSYSNEDFCDHLFLTTGEESLDDDDLFKAGNMLEDLNKGDFGSIELSSGNFASIVIE